MLRTAYRIELVHLADAIKAGVPRAALQKFETSRDREWYLKKDVDFLRQFDEESYLFDSKIEGNYGDKLLRERWLGAGLKRFGMKVHHHSKLYHAFSPRRRGLW